MQKAAINKQGRSDGQWGWGEERTRNAKNRLGKKKKKNSVGELKKGKKNGDGKDRTRNEGKVRNAKGKDRNEGKDGIWKE